MWRPSSEATPPARAWLIGLLFVVATLLAYSPAWQGEPVFDDHDHLMRPELQSLDGLGRIWTEFGVVSQYYPVFHTGLWLQGALWGHWMPGYHIVNILLHAACALLLLRLLHRLEVPGAVLAAAMFLLHPVMVESVAWISELKNTLSTAFYIAAALCYLRFDETRRPGFYAAALILFVAGLLSKSVVASLPAALLVVFWWRRGRLSWRKDACPLLPFFFAALAMGALTIWTEKHFIGASGEAYALSFAQRCLIASRACWFYLGKLAWPADLSFIYPRWTVNAAAPRAYLFPLAALLLLAGAWRLRHRSRAPLATLLFFAGTLVPALGFINVYPFRYSFVADHYQYLASLGPFVFAAAAGTVAFRSVAATVAGQVSGGLLLVILGVLTVRQSALYRDAETLWTATLIDNPECFVAHGNLGYIHLQAGRLTESATASERAIALQPDYADAWTNLGAALRLQGSLDAAILNLRQALVLEPGLAAAHYNLALSLLDTGRDSEALQHLREAVRLRPNFAPARNNLGDRLLREGRMDEAETEFAAALALEPDDPDVHANLGNIELRRGRLAEARGHYETALKLAPKHVEAHYNLGVLSEAENRPDEAMRHYQIALTSRPELAEAHNNLGLLWLKKGRPEEALRHIEKAVAAQPRFAEARYNLGLCLLKAGKTERAVTELEKLLRLQPGLQAARDLLARIRGDTRSRLEDSKPRE